MNRYHEGYCEKHSKRFCDRCRKEDERQTDWGVFVYEKENRYRRESALKIYRSKALAQKAADRSDENLVVRSVSRVLTENPTNTALVAGAVAAAAILAFVFWPKKAAAAPALSAPTCGTTTEIKSFIAAKGLHVNMVENAPTTETPPAGYNAATERVYNKGDCSFYRYLSLDGAKSTWVKDGSLNTQFAAWKANK